MLTSYNIKQITGYDLEGKQTTTHEILVPNLNKDTHKIEFITETVEYVYALQDVEIAKLGYCCEPKGIIYPIYLQMDNKYHYIQIGRDGMYEMQPEDWQNINEEGSEVRTTDVIITGVQVPKDINFTLDYIVPIN